MAVSILDRVEVGIALHEAPSFAGSDNHSHGDALLELAKEVGEFIVSEHTPTIQE